MLVALVFDNSRLCKQQRQGHSRAVRLLRLLWNPLPSKTAFIVMHAMANKRDAVRTSPSEVNGLSQYVNLLRNETFADSGSPLENPGDKFLTEAGAIYGVPASLLRSSTSSRARPVPDKLATGDVEERSGALIGDRRERGSHRSVCMLVTVHSG